MKPATNQVEDRRPATQRPAEPCPPGRDHVVARFGEAHPFWDIDLTVAQCGHVDPDATRPQAISVMVGDHGGISLNGAHDPGSAEDERERALFDAFEPAIRVAVADAVRITDEFDYAPFLREQAARRSERTLAGLRAIALLLQGVMPFGQGKPIAERSEAELVGQLHRALGRGHISCRRAMGELDMALADMNALIRTCGYEPTYAE